MHCTSMCMSAIGLLLLTAGPAAHAGGPPIVSTTFETDAGDWRVVNVANQPTDTAKLSITHDAANVKEGKGSLKFDYVIKKGDVNFIMLPTQPPALAKMKSLHFWVKTDHSTSMILFVSEKDSGRYKTTFTATANTWQEVSIGLSDLVLSEDEGDPKDPDGKLDPDQIEGIALVDIDCFLTQMLGDNPTFVNLASGPHSLFVNSFTIDDTALASATTVPGEKQFTSLLRPQTEWMLLGDISVQRTEEKPLTGPSMKVSYTQAQGKVFALLKQIPIGSFAGVTRIDFSAASKIPVSLMVQVEDTKGNKFNSTVMVPGNAQANDYTLKIADFAVANDSKDPAAKLDLSLVKQLIVMDVSGFGAVEEKANTLWINKLRAIK